MTVRVEITEDTASPAVTQALQGLQGDAVRLMLGDIGEYLMSATRERAKRQVAPDGATWQALSPRYLARKNKKRAGLPILKFDNHMLGDRLAWQVEGDDTVTVGTSAKYGAAHQFGATIKIFARRRSRSDHCPPAFPACLMRGCRWPISRPLKALSAAIRCGLIEANWAVCNHNNASTITDSTSSRSIRRSEMNIHPLA